MAALQKTELHEYHLELGAKMVPVAGWTLPLHYSEGIITEHRHTRSGASVFDRGFTGKFRLAGAGAAAALDSLLLYAVSRLTAGDQQRNVLLRDDAGVLDELTLLCMASDDFLLLLNLESLSLVRPWLEQHLPQTLPLQDLSAGLACLLLTGPAAAAAMTELGPAETELPRQNRWSKLALDDITGIVVYHDFLGEEGWLLLFNAEYTDQIWDLLLDTEPVEAAAIGAYDSLRLEAGRPIFLHELHTEWSIADCGIEAPPADNRTFPGKTALATRRPTRQLTGVRLDTRRASRPGSAVLNEKEEKIGVVTSGSFAPSLDCAVALCSLELAVPVIPGDRLILEAGDAKLPGTVVELPFYRSKVGL